MKQGRKRRKYTVCAVGPIIGNDEVRSSTLRRGTRNHYIFPKHQTNRLSHNAAISGTYRVYAQSGLEMR